MKGTVTNRKQALESIRRLRKETDPKWKPELDKIADELEALLNSTSKGGTSRAKKLTKKRRKEIATNAANARWAQRKPTRGSRGRKVSG